MYFTRLLVGAEMKGCFGANFIRGWPQLALEFVL